MPYQALYRKYRPKDFDSMVGQKQVIQTLKNALERDRIAHAYLFTGPRGTGKTSAAKIFAKALNCTGENPPCGKCDNCKAAASGNHPDIIEIDAASNNGVDEVRALIDKVYYSPILGKYKVYIIDEVHMMTTGAFNALLKTIEEPPENVIFILATTEPNKVLPTILSRCQRFDFGKVSESDIQKRLSQVCQEENYPAQEEALELIASLAQGGMRDSLSILDQCIAYSPDALNSDDVRAIYGVVTTNDIAEVFHLLKESRIDQAIQKVEEFADQGMDLKRFTSDFIHLLKDSILYSLSDQTTLISEQQKKIIQREMNESPVPYRVHMLQSLMDTYNKLGYASNVLDYIQVALMKSGIQKSDSSLEHQYDQQITPQIREEKGSEKSEISQGSHLEKPEIPSKQKLSDLFWKSDVSRETFSNEQKKSEPVRFDDEMLLGLLTGGNKSEKKSDERFLNQISNYMNDLQYGRFAASLRHARQVASGSNYMLICFDSDIQADQVNDLEDAKGFEGFTDHVLGVKKKVFAVSRDRANQLIQLFKQRAKAGTLPSPFKVEIQLRKEEQEKKPEDYLKTIFPDLKVIDD